MNCTNMFLGPEEGSLEAILSVLKNLIDTMGTRPRASMKIDYYRRYSKVRGKFLIVILNTIMY